MDSDVATGHSLLPFSGARVAFARMASPSDSPERAEVDQLAYSYTSNTNQLQSVTNTGTSNTDIGLSATTYNYDGNGNLLSATNITDNTHNKSFSYNILNLPIVATIPAGTATYTYDATGNKLRKVDALSGVTTTTDYINGIQYNGNGTTDTLSFIQTEEGKAVHNGTTYDYQYYLGDNLGNTRITFNTKTGTAYAVQQDDYYPFGMEILRGTLLSNKNEYLYNKKELQEEFSEYDYGARFYDPVIARWTTVDPLAEKSRRWSPYNYVQDSPIRLIDPDGMMDNLTLDQAQQIESQQANAWGQLMSQVAVNAAIEGKPGSGNSGNECCGTIIGQTQKDHVASSANTEALKKKTKKGFGPKTFFDYLKLGGEVYGLSGDVIPRATIIAKLTAIVDILANAGNEKEAKAQTLDLFKDIAIDRTFSLLKIDNPLNVPTVIYDYMTKTVYGQSKIGETWAANYIEDSKNMDIAIKAYGQASDQADFWGKRSQQDYEGMRDALDAINELKGGGE